MLSFCRFIVVIDTSNISLSRDCVRYIRCLAKELYSENCTELKLELGAKVLLLYVTIDLVENDKPCRDVSSLLRLR